MAKLTRTELENHLWKSADILRGSIDSSDYKIYIFGFLFLKRLSDRFEEEAKEAIRQGLPEDVAAGLLYLASPAASYVTGQVLTIDGGMTG